MKGDESLSVGWKLYIFYFFTHFLLSSDVYRRESGWCHSVPFFLTFLSLIWSYCLLINEHLQEAKTFIPEQPPVIFFPLFVVMHTAYPETLISFIAFPLFKIILILLIKALCFRWCFVHSQFKSAEVSSHALWQCWLIPSMPQYVMQHFSRFELRMGKTSPETIVFKVDELPYLEFTDNMTYISNVNSHPLI